MLSSPALQECVICGAGFQYPYPGAVACSSACRIENRRRKRNEKQRRRRRIVTPPPQPKNCAVCGTILAGRHRNAQFCSDCFAARYAPRCSVHPCARCNNVIVKASRKFCSECNRDIRRESRRIRRRARRAEPAYRHSELERRRRRYWAQREKIQAGRRSRRRQLAAVREILSVILPPLPPPVEVIPALTHKRRGPQKLLQLRLRKCAVCGGDIGATHGNRRICFSEACRMERTQNRPKPTANQRERSRYTRRRWRRANPEKMREKRRINRLLRPRRRTELDKATRRERDRRGAIALAAFRELQLVEGELCHDPC
jgi:hypothetical protein